MDKLTPILLFGFLIGISAVIFMGYVFFNEGVIGRGVFYYENNRAIALFEFGLCAVGFVILCLACSALITHEPKEKDTLDDKVEPFGVSTDYEVGYQ